MPKIEIADKVTGGTYSAAEWNQVKGVINAIDDLIIALKGGSTETVAGLKSLIDSLQTSLSGIQTLLQSNDVNLDALQEIVTYIKANKALIDSITTDKLSTSTYNAFLTQYALDLSAKVGAATGSPVVISSIWSGSQAQYDAIAVKNANTLYFTT